MTINIVITHANGDKAALLRVTGQDDLVLNQGDSHEVAVWDEVEISVTELDQASESVEQETTVQTADAPEDADRPAPEEDIDVDTEEDLPPSQEGLADLAGEVNAVETGGTSEEDRQAFTDKKAEEAPAEDTSGTASEGQNF